AARDGRQVVLNDRLALRVERAGRLVEDQYARLGHEGARDGEPLLLPAREIRAVLHQHGVQPLRQAVDELGRAGHPCSEQDLLQGRVELGDGDVLPHRAVEQKGFLEHHPDIAPQVVELDVARVHAIQSYYALLRGVQPLDQARQRRFPAPAAPDDADHVAGRYPEGDAIDRARLRHVREHDVVEFDISANRWRDAALNAAFGALVHHFAQHAHRARHLLILVEERDDLAARAGYPSREHLEGDQRADADGAIEDVGRADRDDGHQHELLQQLRARLREGGNL